MAAGVGTNSGERRTLWALRGRQRAVVWAGGHWLGGASRLAVFAVLWCGVVLGPVGPPPVGAVPVARASARQRQRRHFSRAQALYRAGRFREALAEYEKALAAKFHPVIVFNIGQCYRQLRMWKKALFAYRLYLSRMPNAPNRAEVREWIRVLEERVAQEEKARSHGKVSVVSEPTGAVVRVDDPSSPPAGRTPSLLTLKAGPHVLYLDFGRGRVVQRVVAVRPGAIETITVSLGSEANRAKGHVAVVSEPAGAEVRVDSPTARPAGVTPLTLELTPCTHVVYVDLPGMPRIRRVVTVRSGQVAMVRVAAASPMRNLSLALQGMSGGLPAGRPQTRERRGYAGWEIAVMVLVGLTGLAGAGAGVSALFDIASNPERAKKTAIAAGVLVGTSLATGLGYGIWRYVSGKQDRRAPRRAWLLPGCSLEGCGVVAGVRF